MVVLWQAHRGNVNPHTENATNPEPLSRNSAFIARTVHCEITKKDLRPSVEFA